MTPRQRELLDFIAQFEAEHRYTPSYREMADALGVGKGRVFDLLRALDASGHVLLSPNRARSVELITRELEPVSTADLVAELNKRGFIVAPYASCRASA